MLLFRLSSSSMPWLWCTWFFSGYERAGHCSAWRRLPVELEPDYFCVSLWPLCFLLRWLIGGNPCEPSHEWTLRLECSKCSSKSGATCECTLTDETSWEWTLLCTLSQEISFPKGQADDVQCQNAHFMAGWAATCRDVVRKSWSLVLLPDTLFRVRWAFMWSKS